MIHQHRRPKFLSSSHSISSYRGRNDILTIVLCLCIVPLSITSLLGEQLRTSTRIILAIGAIIEIALIASLSVSAISRRNKLQYLLFPTFIFLIIAPTRIIRFATYPIYISDLFIVICAISTYLYISRDGWNTNEALQKSTLKLMILFGLTLLSSFFVGVVQFGLIASTYVYTRVVLSILMLFVIVVFSTERQKIIKLARIITIVGSLSSILAIIQVQFTDLWITYFSSLLYEGGPNNATISILMPWLVGNQSPSIFRAFGGYGNSASFGGLLAAIFPIIMYTSFNYKKGNIAIRVVVRLFPLVSAFALFLTFTRHAWLALLVSTLIVATIRAIKSGRSAQYLTSAAVIFIAGAWSISNLLVLGTTRARTSSERVLSILYIFREANVSDRLDNYPYLLRFYIENPIYFVLGSGHSYLYNARRYVTIASEGLSLVKDGFLSNSILLPLYNYGIITWIIFILIIYRIYTFILHIITHREPFWSLENAISISFITATLNMASDNYMHMVMWQQSIFWIISGMIVALRFHESLSVSNCIQNGQ